MIFTIAGGIVLAIVALNLIQLFFEKPIEMIFIGFAVYACAIGDWSMLAAASVAASIYGWATDKPIEEKNYGE